MSQPTIKEQLKEKLYKFQYVTLEVGKGEVGVENAADQILTLITQHLLDSEEMQLLPPDISTDEINGVEGETDWSEPINTKVTQIRAFVEGMR